MLAAIAAMLIASLAAPQAFGRDGVTFAIAYLVVRALHLVLYAIAGRGDRELLGAVLRIVPTVAVSCALLVVAGVLDGAAQLACWAAAAAIDYVGPLVGHMRGWRISPAHFVERFGQIILIALGESVIAIGVGAQGLDLDARLVAGALLGICVIACLWWSYFDWVVYVAQSRLEEASGKRRAALARDVYSYLHLPMVGGVVLFAFRSRDRAPRSGGLPQDRARIRPRCRHRALPARPCRASIANRRWSRTRTPDRIRCPARVAPDRNEGARPRGGRTRRRGVRARSSAYEAVRHRESRALIRARRSGVDLGADRAPGAQDDIKAEQSEVGDGFRHEPCWLGQFIS